MKTISVFVVSASTAALAVAMYPVPILFAALTPVASALIWWLSGIALHPTRFMTNMADMLAEGFCPACRNQMTTFEVSSDDQGTEVRCKVCKSHFRVQRYEGTDGALRAIVTPMYQEPHNHG